MLARAIGDTRVLVKKVIVLFEKIATRPLWGSVFSPPELSCCLFLGERLEKKRYFRIFVNVVLKGTRIFCVRDFRSTREKCIIATHHCVAFEM